MKLDEWLKQKVKEKEMTQKELAEYLGVTPSAVSRYLSGQSEPAFRHIKKLAKLFDTPESELLGLKWQDIDWEKQTISIEKTLTYLKGEFILEEPKTKGSCRTIPLFPEAVEVLKRWKKQWLEERIKLGADWPNTDLVFPSEAHTPMNPRNFLRTLKSILKEAGLSPDITIHSLRHTYATILLTEGEHPKVVQELLGHASITTTLDIYSRVMPGLKEQAVKKLEKVLDKGKA